MPLQRAQRLANQRQPGGQCELRNFASHVIISCAAPAASGKRESGQSTGQLFGDSCWPGQASLLIPTVLPLARVARLALGAVSFEWISIAEAADATDRL